MDKMISQMEVSSMRESAFITMPITSKFFNKDRVCVFKSSKDHLVKKEFLNDERFFSIRKSVNEFGIICAVLSVMDVDNTFICISSADLKETSSILDSLSGSEKAQSSNDYFYSFQIVSDTEESCLKVYEMLTPFFYEKLKKSYFNMVVAESGGYLYSRKVEVENRIKSPEEISLNYEGLAEKDAEILTEFRDTSHGLFIFRGDPGTGKTSYIRYLIDVLSETHSFYFIPTMNFQMLTDTNFTDFWIRESESVSDKKKVIILEDAESLLTSRDNGMLSSLLNIADGLMGDFLQMQIICTANCQMDVIDSAVVRNGRMLIHHEFNKLSRKKAQELCDKRGLELKGDQENYSLGEIYKFKKIDINKQEKKIGF